MAEKYATLDDIMELFSGYVNEEDVIYSKTIAKLVSVIIKERKRHGCSQSDFAKVLNTKQSVVSRWESGSSNFTIKTLSKIAASLDLDLYVNLTPHTDIKFTNVGPYVQATVRKASYPKSFSGQTIIADNSFTHKSTHISNWKEFVKCSIM